jgi:hypothetical protein
VGAEYGGGAQFTMEPHIAEQVFNEMANTNGLTVYTNEHLVSVVMSGQKIILATMSDGHVFSAKEFVDASYEGDLMAMAGVSNVIGREANSQYGESLAGVTGGSGFGGVNISPYVVANDPTSGLISYVQTNVPGAVGSADGLVQTYNFRMCLTTIASNMIPITAPTNYNSTNYLLLSRYIQAAGITSLSSLLNIFLMPNNKTDINNKGPVSTDFIGYSWTYPTNTFAGRAQIYQAHQNYIQGLLYFLANDPGVPSGIKSSMQAYGYCKDEFADNGNWSYALYVREARRMVSDYVMTQSNALGQVKSPDSIGLACYPIDAHSAERTVVGGYVRNEGSVGNLSVSPFPISYRSIVPHTNECSNLLVPWCLSASHVCFGAIRMEPTGMVLGQSAATAACFAIDDGVAVQQVNLAKLQAQLTVDKQLLQWGNSANNTSNLPVINLWATDANASRFGPQAGSFTISCTANTNTTLTIYLYIGGTAIYGYDCQYLANSITIPAGVASTNIGVIPYTNALPVGDKTITFSLLPGAAYAIGGLASAVVTISDTPINDWRLQFFGVNATNPAIAGDLASPAGDGIPNLMKYATGLNPTNAEAAGAQMVIGTDTNGFPQVSFARADPLPADITCQLQVSTNLTSWSTNLTGLSQCIAFNVNHTATITSQSQNPAGNFPNEFFRLQVTRK